MELNRDVIIIYIETNNMEILRPYVPNELDSQFSRLFENRDVIIRWMFSYYKVND